MGNGCVLYSAEKNEKQFLDLWHSTSNLFLVKNAQSEAIITTPQLAIYAGYSNPINYLGVNDYQIQCPTVALAGEFISQDKLALKSNGVQGYILFTTYANSDAGVYIYTKTACHNHVVCNLWKDEGSAIAKYLYAIIKNTNINSRECINICFDIILSYDHLTQTESKILYFLMQGLSSTQIGHLIFLSKRTIQHYIEHIKHKSGCRTTVQLVQQGMMLQYNRKIPASLLGPKVVNLLYGH